jgi:YjjG family noncanonical pyrimidine nucleotidase
MTYKWLLFDADGTLFDYDAAEFNALKLSFASFNLPFAEDHLVLYRQFNKGLWERFEQGEITIPRLKTERFKLLLAELGIKMDSHLFSSTYLNHLSMRPDLIEGAKELVQYLYGRFSLVLITNGIKEVQRSRLNLSPINDYFYDIIISDEVGSAKPDKRIFEIAHDRMNSPEKDSILIIGDNLVSDIKGGNEFGIDTCWYNPVSTKLNAFIKPTYEIKNLDEIPGLVE